MALVRRFIFPHAVAAGEDLYVANAGLFRLGVLDIPASSTGAITAALSVLTPMGVTDLGQVDNAVTPPPSQPTNSDPFPQYLTINELAGSVQTGSDPFAVALKAALVAPLPTVGSLTYNADGTVASDQDGNTYTWNTDGTPATQTKGGVTRTFHWATDGTLASVS